MGRRTLIALVVAALPLGVAVAPASAKRKGPFIISAGTTDRTHTSRSLPGKVRMQFAFGPSVRSDKVLYNGYRAECTAPAYTSPTHPSTNTQNLYSSDTFEFQNASGTIVETCTANLNSADPINGTLGTDNQPVAYNTAATTWIHVTSCGVFSPLSTSIVLLGTGYAVTYENGLFTETCTVQG
jgi:hypothetical protein